MCNLAFRTLLIVCFAVPTLSADVVILRDGSSYSGHLNRVKILFTGNNDVGFSFPVYDIQSLVFNPIADTITLTSGKTYSGHYAGRKELAFAGSEGVSYRFPVSEVTSLVLTARTHQAERNASHDVNQGGTAKVITEGTAITITTNERIDSKSARDGQLFAATITADVVDSQGATVIRSGTPAQLVVRKFVPGGALSTPELVLDLYSLNLEGRQYRTLTTNVVEHGRDSLGGNRRTLAFTAGGSGLGALFGGVFGGGRGAGIGALAGAGGGALTQLFTRGKRVTVPPEATLMFHLDRTLVLRPAAQGVSTASS